MLEYQLSEHQIRGWRAVFAPGLRGKGLHRRIVFSQTPVCRLPRLASRLLGRRLGKWERALDAVGLEDRRLLLLLLL